MPRLYWLMKSEPETYSIDDLAREKVAYWDGVRNYQARNFMRDKMQKADLVFFYHSNADPSGIAGMAEVSKESYPDPSAFDPKSKYYDPKSKIENPTWFLVDVKFVRKFNELISLEQLRQVKGLENMLVLKKGQRLSIQPVTQQEWELVCQLTG